MRSFRQASSRLRQTMLPTFPPRLPASRQTAKPLPRTRSRQHRPRARRARQKKRSLQTRHPPQSHCREREADSTDRGREERDRRSAACKPGIPRKAIAENEKQTAQTEGEKSETEEAQLANQ